VKYITAQTAPVFPLIRVLTEIKELLAS
jgi:hypothetical protein